MRNNISKLEEKRHFICKGKKCPGCIDCLRNKNSNYDSKKENEINLLPYKKSLIEEENKDGSESEEKEKIEEENEEKKKQDEIQIESSEANEDIDNELTGRGSIFIHNFTNKIRLPHKHQAKNSKILTDKNRKKNNRRKSKTNNELNSRDINSSEESDSKNKAKSAPKIKDGNNEDNDRKKKIKSAPKLKSINEKSIKKLIKIKKIELLRE